MQRRRCCLVLDMFEVSFICRDLVSETLNECASRKAIAQTAGENFYVHVADNRSGTRVTFCLRLAGF